MDGRPRQNPAYRLAKEEPRSGGALLFRLALAQREDDRLAADDPDLGDRRAPPVAGVEPRPVRRRWTTREASGRTPSAARSSTGSSGTALTLTVRARRPAPRYRGRRTGCRSTTPRPGRRPRTSDEARATG